MKRRIWALLLSLAMTVGLLAGCGSKEAAESKGTEAASKGDKTTVEETTEETTEPVSLRLVMYGDTSTRREEFFAKDFHDIIMEELNIDLTVEFFPWSEMNGTSVINMLASGESFAVEYIITLADFHTKGYLAPISLEDIEANMPGYLEMRGATNGFDAAKYNDEIYLLPLGNKPYSGHGQSVAVRNDLLNEVGKDAADIHTYDDFMAAIAAVKEKYPDITVMHSADQLSMALSEYLGGVNVAEAVDPFVKVDENADNDEVWSYYESELFKNMSKTMESWIEMGYLSTEVMTNPNQSMADWDAGNALCNFGTASRLISFGSPLPQMHKKKRWERLTLRHSQM